MKTLSAKTEFNGGMVYMQIDISSLEVFTYISAKPQFYTAYYYIMGFIGFLFSSGP